MAELLKDQFEKAFSIPKYGEFNISSFYDLPKENSLLDLTITEQQIIDAISEMPNNTSSGPDSWPSELLKMCKDQLCHPLAKIFNKSMKEGVLPEDFLKANITPIFKKGSRTKAINYRPISLTSLISKILARIIRKKIISHLESHNLINDIQHGFRRGRSCISQLLDHYDTVLYALENGSDYDVET